MQKGSTKQDIQLASWAQNTQPSTIQEMLAIATQPDVLSFALGLPGCRIVPGRSLCSGDYSCYCSGHPFVAIRTSPAMISKDILSL